jgi:predicted DNA-binding protein
MMKLAKQKKTQQFCMKLNSSFLAKYNWDLTLPVEEARKTPGVIISLADSQILTWINELNGTEDFDEKAKAIKREIKQIKKEKSSKENKKRIKDLYSNLYKLQFKEDYLCLIIDKLSDYDRANKGFKVNGVEYRRLLTTTNGVKTSTVVYTSVRLVDELKKRIENGRNTQVKMVPAKLGAYEALCSSASIPVSWPKGIIVVKDCITKFKSDLINIDDSYTTREPIVEFAPMQEVVNNASDGCSMMLPSLSMRWNGELEGDPERTISGCNLRRHSHNDSLSSRHRTDVL